MATLPLVLGHGASTPQSMRTGFALAVTVALFYGLCTVLWLVAPGPFMSFMNSVFHGMDFTPLSRPAAFSWFGFFGVLIVMSVWGFLAGAFFAWLRERLA